MAVTAHNCRLKSGKLVPVRNPSRMIGSSIYFENGLSEIADAKSLYCWKHTLSNGSVRTDFVAFPGIVHFAKSNIADDEYDRIFVTGETGVQFRPTSGSVRNDTPSVWLFDRIHNSVVRHTLCKDVMDRVKVSVSGEIDRDKLRYTYFFITWFDEYGYESGLSLPSFAKNGNEADWSDQTLEYNDGSVVHFEPVVVPVQASGIRIYQAVTGSENENVQFIKEISGPQLSTVSVGFDIKISDADAGEVYPDITSAPDDLDEMIAVSGGFYAGRMRSKPHTVLFSALDNPTSWPLGNRYDVSDNIVCLATTSNTVFALTDGYPYVLSGTAPDTMSVASIAGPAACVSPRAVCVLGNNLFYVSNYGLYVIANDANAGTVCKCLTEKIFTKSQWQALNPSSAIMGQFDGALHLFFDNDIGMRGMIIDLNENADAVTTHDEIATCLATDDRTDELYFVREV